tara:strand:+ start:3232 stop:3525 length:294 start_codon:yes stop_codon:yes gene_type:complete
MKQIDAQQQPLDRYQSFCGLDCQARAEQLVAYICQLSRQKERNNPFWCKFTASAEAKEGADALLLVHTNIFYMRELLEKHPDNQWLRLLDALENDCC